MSAMSDMSRAIRGVVEKHDPLGENWKMGTVPKDVLVEVTTMVGAFYADFHEELERRRAEGSA